MYTGFYKYRDDFHIGVSKYVWIMKECLWFKDYIHFLTGSYGSITEHSNVYRTSYNMLELFTWIPSSPLLQPGYENWNDVGPVRIFSCSSDSGGSYKASSV